MAIGPAALQNTNGTGSFSGGGNNAVGQDALQGNTTGFANNSFGFKAFSSNTIGVENTAFGDQALLSSTTGGGNTAIGAFALSIIPLALPIQPWALMPGLMSPLRITLSLSALTWVVRTWITAALSAKSSVKPLRVELRFSLIQTAD